MYCGMCVARRSLLYDILPERCSNLRNILVVKWVHVHVHSSRGNVSGCCVRLLPQVYIAYVCIYVEATGFCGHVALNVFQMFVCLFLSTVLILNKPFITLYYYCSELKSLGSEMSCPCLSRNIFRHLHISVAEMQNSF